MYVAGDGEVWVKIEDGADVVAHQFVDREAGCVAGGHIVDVVYGELDVVASCVGDETGDVSHECGCGIAAVGMGDGGVAWTRVGEVELVVVDVVCAAAIHDEVNCAGLCWNG